MVSRVYPGTCPETEDGTHSTLTSSQGKGWTSSKWSTRLDTGK